MSYERTTWVGLQAAAFVSTTYRKVYHVAGVHCHKKGKKWSATRAYYHCTKRASEWSIFMYLRVHS